MRSQKQRTQRLERIRLANEILAWLEGKGKKRGIYSYASVIGPFLQEKSADRYEVWQAWNILKEAGRRSGLPGPKWSINSFDPIAANENRDIYK